MDLLKGLRSLADRYMDGRGRVVRAIASGGSAAVYVVQEAKREYALKVYDPLLLQGKNAAAELRRIELQRHLIGHDCPWLVQMHAVNVRDSGCFIEMEYVPWRTLKAALPEVPNAQVRALLSQLVAATKFLEDKGIVHRDIKPENLLVSPDFSELRLIDLGVGRATEDLGEVDATDHGDRRPFVATAQYSSPEYLFRIETPSPDMWRALNFYQIGGVLHDLLIKRPLFEEAARTENKHVISMAVFREVPDLSDAPNEYRNLALLAAHCLTKDPSLRLRLVSWDRFSVPGLDGEQLLRESAVQKNALKAAEKILQDSKLKTLTQRAQFVKGCSEDLQEDLLAILSGAYSVTVFRDSADVIGVILGDAQGNVHIRLKFEWATGSELNRGAVVIQACMPLPPYEACARAVVIEIAADASAALFCKAAIDRIGVLVQTAQALGTRAPTQGTIDLVAKSSLK